MHFALTEEQQAIQETALAFARERIAPDADKWDETSHFPIDVIRETAALGMAAIYVPEDKGGTGLSRLDGALIMEARATGCPAISAYISIHNMVAWMISKAGTPEQIERWMPKLASMEWLASYCLTEPGAGSDAAALQTRAEKSGDHYILNGTKQFISGAGATDFYFVFARTGDASPNGVSAFAIEKGAPGLSFGANERKMGWNAQPTAQVIMENVKVRRPISSVASRGRASASPCPVSTAGASTSAPARSAPPGRLSTRPKPTSSSAAHSASTSASSRPCSSRSPTWRPTSKPPAS